MAATMALGMRRMISLGLWLSNRRSVACMETRTRLFQSEKHMLCRR